MTKKYTLECYILVCQCQNTKMNRTVVGNVCSATHNKSCFIYIIIMFETDAKKPVKSIKLVLFAVPCRRLYSLLKHVSSSKHMKYDIKLYLLNY